MLEIFAIGFIIAGLIIFLRRRAGKKPPAPRKPTVYVCDRCGEADCHCERRL